MKLWELAREILAQENKPLTASQIWERIRSSGRYHGSSDDPFATLRTALARKTIGRTEAWTTSNKIFHATPDKPRRYGLSEWRETVNAALSEIEENEIDHEFDPKNKDDARERIARSIALRRGQPKFRKILFDAYDGRCAITGCIVKVILEAAHITPYKGTRTNKLANGLLLRADIHTLFDLGYITIDTASMTVVLASELVSTKYGKLNGLQLNAKPEVLQMIKAALDEHGASFQNSRPKK